MSVTNDTLHGKLACPVDRGALALNKDLAQCTVCRREYPVEDGIFRLMPPPSPAAAHAYHEQKGRDEEAHIYDKNIGLNFLTNFEYSHYSASLMNGNGHAPALLELACGTGRMTVKFAPHFSHMYAVDVSVESLRVLRKKIHGTPLAEKITLVHGDAAHLPFAENSFRKIACFQMFQHLPSHEVRCKMLDEIQTVLKNDGHFVMSVYRDHPVTTTLFKKEGVHPNGSYFYRYSKKELEYILDGYFDVKEIKPLPFFYVWLASCRK